jgi:glycosyltransferase involved in cell wall biosynthesis
VEAAHCYPNFRPVGYFLVDIHIQLEDWTGAMTAIERMLVRFKSEPWLLEAAARVRNQIGPMRPSDTPRDRPSVSLCMIVRNEEGHLPRCLASLKPLVDEMIVVDTGSTDATKEVADLFGARVFEYPWADDYAAARNHALSKATGAWILVMDADEVLAPQDHEKLWDAIKRTTSGPAAYSITTRNYTNRCNSIDWQANDGRYVEEAGTGWFPSEKVRLFPNDPAIRFEYPVHELVEPSLERAGYAIVPLPVPVHHYGKLETEKAGAKGDLYYEIGKRKLSELGENPVALRELAVQAGVLGKRAEAIDLWKRLLTLEPRNVKALVNLSGLLADAGEYAEATDAALQAVAAAPEMKEAVFNLARCRLLGGQARSAASAFTRLNRKHPAYYPAIFHQGCAEICAGQFSKGLRTLKILRPSPWWPSLGHAFQTLATTLQQTGRKDFSAQVLNAADALGLPKVMASDLLETGEKEPEPMGEAERLSA